MVKSARDLFLLLGVLGFIECSSRKTQVEPADEPMQQSSAGVEEDVIAAEEGKSEDFISPDKLMGNDPKEVEEVLKRNGFFTPLNLALGTAFLGISGYVIFRLTKGRNPAKLIPGEFLSAYKRRYSSLVPIDGNTMKKALSEGDNVSSKAIDQAYMQAGIDVPSLFRGSRTVEVEYDETIQEVVQVLERRKFLGMPILGTGTPKYQEIERVVGRVQKVSVSADEDVYRIFKAADPEKLQTFLNNLDGVLNTRAYDPSKLQEVVRKSEIVDGEDIGLLTKILNQSIEESPAVLRKFQYELAHLNLKSLVNNRLKERAKDFYEKQPDLSKLIGELDSEKLTVQDGETLFYALANVRSRVIQELVAYDYKGANIASETGDFLKKTKAFKNSDIDVLVSGTDAAARKKALEAIVRTIEAKGYDLFVVPGLRRWFREFLVEVPIYNGNAPEAFGERRGVIAALRQYVKQVDKLDVEKEEILRPNYWVVDLSKRMDSEYLGNQVRQFIQSGLAKTEEFRGWVGKPFSQISEWLKKRMPGGRAPAAE